MSDYTQITSFGPKDSLPSGNPGKLIKGVEQDAELDAVSTAIISKYDDTDVASQAEAEALSLNTKLITPARAADIITQAGGAGITHTAGVLNIVAVANGGVLINASNVELDIAGLTTQGSAAASTDLVPIELAGGGKRKVTVSDLVSGTGFVSTGRLINTTAPVTGGGDLTGDLTIAVSAASLTAAGVVERATQAEVDTGTDTTRYISPATLRANMGFEIFAAKTADTVRESTVTLANDPHLIIGLLANKRYYVKIVVQMETPNGSGPDIKFNWNYSSTLQSTSQFIALSGKSSNELAGNGSTITDTALSSTPISRVFEGIVWTTGAGNLSFQWAQNLSLAAPDTTAVYAGSWIGATEVPGT